MIMREKVPISQLTTMRLGAEARYLSEIETLADLREALAFAKHHQLKSYIIGSGSNIIGRDGGFNGLILLNKMRGDMQLHADDGGYLLKVASGHLLDDVVAFACEHGLSGLEAMSGIPGTIGAAPVQNAGAYGQDISQTLCELEVYDLQTDQILCLQKPDCHFSYRKSIFNTGPKAGRYFILSLTLRLSTKKLKPPFYTSLQAYLEQHHINDYSPTQIRHAVLTLRQQKLPDLQHYASAGSFFKNIYVNDQQAREAAQKSIPVWAGGKIPAGWLLEHAGLKGKDFYGFRVWDKAALILVNESAHSYSQLAAARAAINKIVQAKYGFTLEQEPVEIGEL